MKKQKYNQKNGFALLYAILLSAVVLMIGVSLMNIIAKQLLFSSFSRGSENSYYYVANSLISCLNNKANTFYQETRDEKGKLIKVEAKLDKKSIKCFGQTLAINGPELKNSVYTYTDNGTQDLQINGKNYKVGFSLAMNIDCIGNFLSFPSTPNCDPRSTNGDLTKKNKFVIIATGYNLPASQNNSARMIKRSIVSVLSI